MLGHPAAEESPVGEAVRARSERGGGWLGWVVSVPDLAPYEVRLGGESVRGSRHFPDGRLLEWQQIGVKGLMSDPQLPYFVEWETLDVHPSHGAEDSGVTIETLQIAGDPERVCEWLGLPAKKTSTVIDFAFVAPHGTPGLLSVTFDTAEGKVVI